MNDRPAGVLAVMNARCPDDAEVYKFKGSRLEKDLHCGNDIVYVPTVRVWRPAASRACEGIRDLTSWEKKKYTFLIVESERERERSFIDNHEVTEGR